MISLGAWIHHLKQSSGQKKHLSWDFRKNCPLILALLVVSSHGPHSWSSSGPCRQSVVQAVLCWDTTVYQPSIVRWTFCNKGNVSYERKKERKEGRKKGRKEGGKEGRKERQAGRQAESREEKLLLIRVARLGTLVAFQLRGSGPCMILWVLPCPSFGMLRWEKYWNGSKHILQCFPARTVPKLKSMQKCYTHHTSYSKHPTYFWDVWRLMTCGGGLWPVATQHQPGHSPWTHRGIPVVAEWKLWAKPCGQVTPMLQLPLETLEGYRT